MEDFEKMRDFIIAYKNMPELWNPKLKHYKNTVVRRWCYDKLLVEYKKVKNSASINDLKKKISKMRTCYRRELKKEINSERSRAGADEVYHSHLWYFHQFEFLRDLEMPLPSRSNRRSDEEPSVGSSERKVKKRRLSPSHMRMEFLKKATDHLDAANDAERKDDASVYGNGWACMFRQMKPEQQLFAKEAVDEILLLGRMNKLKYNYLHSGKASSPLSGSTPHLEGTDSPVSESSDSSLPFFFQMVRNEEEIKLEPSQYSSPPDYAFD